MGAAPKYVIGKNIVELLWATSKQIGFYQLGFSPYKIDSHLLRSWDTTTLHQAHITNITIKIIWIWRSDAFLIYLQVKVATFTK